MSKKYEAPFAELKKFDSSKYSAPVLDYLDSKVRFSLKSCDISKAHCISNVAGDKRLLKDLYKRLGHFEEMDWTTAKSLTHDKGISIEKKDSSNHKKLSACYADFDTFGHLRVNSDIKPIFRIFGAVRDDLFYILWFDIDGLLNH